MGKEKRIRKSRSRGIAETYIHIKTNSSKLSREEAKAYLEKNVQVWVKEHFKKPVTIKIRVEEGSLKIWIYIGGTLFTLVAGYGSFRSGIDYVVSDSKAFSKSVIEHFKDEENVPPEAVIRAEKRLGVPGKIQRYYKKLDNLNALNRSDSDRTVFIEELKEELLQIILLLECEEDRQLVIENSPAEISNNIPEQLP